MLTYSFSTADLAEAVRTAAEIEAAGKRFETPCGTGSMVWRRYGSGQPVILAHGGSGSWRHWIKTIPDLSRDYELWVADLPGLGSSAMPDDPPTPQSAAKAFAQGVRELFADGRRPHLATFSFGGHVGTLAAAELGNRITGLTLSGCAALGLKQGIVQPLHKERSSMTEADRLDMHAKNLAIFMIADLRRVDALAAYLQAENIREARFRSAPFAANSDIKDTLPHIKVPLSAIWAEKDATVWPSNEARLAILREHHPEMRTHLIADCGHWAMYEQPDAYNRALRAVLEV